MKLDTIPVYYINMWPSYCPVVEETFLVLLYAPSLLITHKLSINLVIFLVVIILGHLWSHSRFTLGSVLRFHSSWLRSGAGDQTWFSYVPGKYSIPHFTRSPSPINYTHIWQLLLCKWSSFTVLWLI